LLGLTYEGEAVGAGCVVPALSAGRWAPRGGRAAASALHPRCFHLTARGEESSWPQIAYLLSKEKPV